jgi:hypothetical protein
MKRRGPRWIIWTGAAGLMLVGGYSTGLALLPVKSTSGCAAISARPRQFTGLFDVVVTDLGRCSYSGKIGPVVCKGGGYAWPRPDPASYGGKDKVRVSVATLPATSAPVTAGLQKLQVEYWDATTEVWVLNLGSKTLAIK